MESGNLGLQTIVDLWLESLTREERDALIEHLEEIMATSDETCQKDKCPLLCSKSNP